jgi:nucleotide-binding universal stress UspA family protein
MKRNKIVVGVDGSPNSLAAVRWAAELADALQSKVVAVHALGLLEHLSADAAPVPVEQHQREIRNVLEHQWTAPLASSGVAFGVELRYGPPVQVLLQTAEAENADLIVVGTRGVTAASPFRLGRTSSELTERSTRPVAVIPMPAGRR